MKPELKLFVWTGFCPDYTDGLAFAIAKNTNEAQELIRKKRGFNTSNWGDLSIHKLNKKIAYCVDGGS